MYLSRVAPMRNIIATLAVWMGSALLAGMLLKGCTPMTSSTLPLFLADGSPAYALPVAVRAGLRSHRLVLACELTHAARYGRGMFLAMVRGVRDDGTAVLRPFLLDCPNERVALLEDLPDDPQSPSLTSVFREPYVIITGGPMPPGYFWASTIYRYSDGRTVELMMDVQRRDGVFRADPSMIYLNDPRAQIIGMAFYQRDVPAALPNEPPPPPPGRYEVRLTTPRPITEPRIDTLAWKKMTFVAEEEAKLRSICRDGTIEARPRELDYLGGNQPLPER